jgi:hypothetical protein
MPELLCPFLSDSENIINCQEHLCKFWVTIDGSETVYDCLFNNFRNSNNNIKELLSNIKELNENINTLNLHKHNQHDHQKIHNAEDLEIIPGTNSFSKNLTTIANQLLSEHLGKEDLDGNGKIFGVDFIIKLDDLEISDFLKTYTENNITITENMDQITMLEYKTSYPEES